MKLLLLLAFFALWAGCLLLLAACWLVLTQVVLSMSGVLR